MALDKLTKVQSVGISSFIQVVGVVTATGGFVGDLTGNITGTTSNASGATGDFSIADKIVHTGDTNTAIRFPAADTITAETGGSERLRITSAGDMGLGTASPTSFGPTLQVAGTDPALLIQDTATAVDFFGMNIASGAVNTWFDDASAFVIHTATGLSGSGLSEKLRITSTGRQQSHAGYDTVGINTFASWARTGGAIRAEVGYNAVTTDYMYFGTGTNHPLALRVNNSNALYIKNDANRSVGIGTDNPGQKLTVKGTTSLMATNSTNQWMAYTYTDNTFRLNYNGAGADELTITSAGLVGVNCTPLSQFQVKTATNANIALSADSSEASIEAYNDAGSANVPLRIRGSEIKFKIDGTQRARLSYSSSSAVLSLGDESNSAGHIRLEAKASENQIHGRSNHPISFLINTSERLRILPSGGITFNGDTAAANALDDYEEGTWTPQLLGGSSNPSLTYSAQSGGYEKIGNLIHLSFFMNVSAVNSQGSGYLELHGLPYVPVTSPLGASEVPALVLQTQPFADGKAANRFAFVRTVGGSSRMFVGYRDLTNGNAIIPTQGAGNISTGYFIGHITYRAS